MSAPVFISYSSNDRDSAMRICQAMEREGIPCWIAPRDIAPGENFMAAIVAAIRNARVMILVFSAHTNESDEVQREIALAGQYRSAVMPVRVQDVAPNDAFTYQFATRQWIDLFVDWDREMTRLIASVRLAVGSAPRPDPAPRPAHPVHDVVPHIALPKDAPPLPVTDEKAPASAVAAPARSRTPTIVGALLVGLALVRILISVMSLSLYPARIMSNGAFVLLSIVLPLVMSLAAGYAGRGLLLAAKQPDPRPRARTIALVICYAFAGYQAFVFSMSAANIQSWIAVVWLNFGLSTLIPIAAILMLWNWTPRPYPR